MSWGGVDHNFDGIADGQVPVWDATNGELTYVDYALYALDDVDPTLSPDPGDVLTFDATLGLWTALPPSGGGGSLDVEDDDVTVVDPATILNFGTGLSVTDDGGGKATVDATGSGGSVDVEDDGTPVASASTLNFGDNLTVTDDGGGQVTIDGTGGGSGTQWLDPVPSGNGPGGTDDDEFDDGAIAGAWTALLVSGNATWTEDADVLSVKYNSQTAGDVAAQLRAISGTPTAPITIDTAVRLFATDQDLARGGVVFSDGTAATSNAIWAFAQLANTGNQLVISLRSGTLTAIDTTPYFTTLLPNRGVIIPWLHIRLVWASANTFQAFWSPDGVSFSDFGQGTDAFTLAPTHYGLAVGASGGALDKISTFEFFRSDV